MILMFINAMLLVLKVILMIYGIFICIFLTPVILYYVLNKKKNILINNKIKE